MWLILIILGVAAEILKANAILVIPSIVEYILFGLGGLLLLVQILNWMFVKKQFKEQKERFDRFGRF